MSQTNRIKEHLKNVGPITPIQALNLYGCFRLGARILELKKEGLPIESRIMKHNNKRFAVYSLQKVS